MTCFILLPHTLDMFKTSLIPNAETNCAVLASERYGLISRGYLAEVKVGYWCGCGRDGGKGKEGAVMLMSSRRGHALSDCRLADSGGAGVPCPPERRHLRLPAGRHRLLDRLRLRLVLHPRYRPFQCRRQVSHLLALLHLHAEDVRHARAARARDGCHAHTWGFSSGKSRLLSSSELPFTAAFSNHGHNWLRHRSPKTVS